MPQNVTVAAAETDGISFYEHFQRIPDVVIGVALAGESRMRRVAVAGPQNEASALALESSLADIGRNKRKRLAAEARQADAAGDLKEAVGVAFAPALLDAGNCHVHGELPVRSPDGEIFVPSLADYHGCAVGGHAVAAGPAALAEDAARGVRLEILLEDAVVKIHRLVVEGGRRIFGGGDGSVEAYGTRIRIIGKVGAVQDVAPLLITVGEAYSARNKAGAAAIYPYDAGGIIGEPGAAREAQTHFGGF